jgi:uncharacterized protein YjaZ
MYKPGARSKKTFEKLKTGKIWDKTQRIYEKYRKAWNGPAIPIFIFPLDETNSKLVREGKGKSGVSFVDKLFLFLTSLEDEKELEALFVHEYHHVCRMNSQKKRLDDYTLLDSIILEGLAEHAVADHCGEEYTGEWSKRYVKKDLSRHWSNNISEKLSLTRDHHLHDKILFGLGNRPNLLGYVLGFEIIKQYKERENISDKSSFIIPAETFIQDFNFH